MCLKAVAVNERNDKFLMGSLLKDACLPACVCVLYARVCVCVCVCVCMCLWEKRERAGEIREVCVRESGRGRKRKRGREGEREIFWDCVCMWVHVRMKHI